MSNKPLTAKEIRESFKQFFAGKGHQIVPSAPMVIKDDPTLMFTNAGMNQFKDIILGNKAPTDYVDSSVANALHAAAQNVMTGASTPEAAAADVQAAQSMLLM